VCAALPAPGKKLRSCELCKQRGLPATYYCSEACQEQGWPGHRAWHKEQKKWFESHAVEENDEQDRATAKRELYRAERTGSKYSQLTAAALKLHAEHDYRRAVRKFREAIALDPLEPMAYHNLGISLHQAGDKAKAAEMFLQARELCKDGSEDWADATACAFNVLRLPALAEAPKPDWWHDDALKTLSARVMATMPNSPVPVNMRAVVLSGLSSAWEAGRRTAAELREAAKLFLHAATLVIAPVEKNVCAGTAAELNKLAEPMEAAEAAARAEEEAVAAAARAEAEANADEAAAALLAELEVEKAGAAAQPSGMGKGKKKGKGKGKGRR
jgi:tetratricopeptide (TPR) repeat protein